MANIGIEDNDARQQERADTLKGAFMVCGPDKTKLHCLVTNLSPEGAELEIGTNARVPNHFTLEVPHEGTAHRAEVRWREPGRIGVALIGKAQPMAPTLKVVSA